MPKRVGNLMPRIASMANLYEAFYRAARGRTGKKVVIDFRQHLDENLANIRRQLLDGSFCFGQYHFFTIHDPKKRTICAASFPERIVFHAMMRICHPVFESFQTNDSFASRKGRGQYAALERTQYMTRRYRWFAKIDVRKYFDSINHELMLSQLARLFKDRQLLLYFRDLIDSYETAEGCGLPIGNLTSQYFANHYLSVADHYAKEHLHVPAMVRYMDDILLFDNDKCRLLQCVREYEKFLCRELLLSTHPAVTNRVGSGLPFLGYVVRPGILRLNARSKRRFRNKMAVLCRKLEKEEIEEREYTDRATCLFSFIEKADVYALKRRMSQTLGIYPEGL